MEIRIWNKTRIWNTFSDDQEVFHIRVYTVVRQQSRVIAQWNGNFNSSQVKLRKIGKMIP